jgi:hypothetical protein
MHHMMPKRKILQLSIPQPCTEDWGGMTPNEQGRHCNNCNKTVVDFSVFTDKQLVDFFSKIAGNVCGRINNYQVERQLVYAEPSRYQFLQKLIFGTIFTAGIVGSANANYNPNSKTIIEHHGLVSNEEQNIESGKNKLKGIDSTYYIMVTVVDSAKKQPFPFATVVLSCNGVQIAIGETDIDGMVKLTYSSEYIGQKIEVRALFAGYQDYNMKTILNKSMPNIEIDMVSHELFLKPVTIQYRVGQMTVKKDTLKK